VEREVAEAFHSRTRCRTARLGSTPLNSDQGDDSAAFDGQPVDPLVVRLEEETQSLRQRLAGTDTAGFVPSELAVVHRALRSVVDQELHRGLVFCEWGSGGGAVCALAASLGLQAYGIEIHGGLVEAAQALLDDLGLEARLAHGSFLQPGDEEFLVGDEATVGETSTAAYDELELSLTACDMVFSYPWPGEESLHDKVFSRHATPGALLLTHGEHAGVLVQRQLADGQELQSLGWFGRAND